MWKIVARNTKIMTLVTVFLKKLTLILTIVIISLVQRLTMGEERAAQVILVEMVDAAIHSQ